MTQGRRFLHGRRRRTQRISRFIRRTGQSFGYLFPYLRRRKSYSFKDTPALRNMLMMLGREMKDEERADQNNPKITAGYTYLGQFIDHDITLDATSDISKRTDARKLKNFRSMRLDLDSVYGRGPVLDVYLYDFSDGLGNKFLLGANGPGRPSAGGEANDLPRNTQINAPAGDPRREQATALIGDPRNDENLIVSQLHVAFLKFHNAVVDQVITDGTNPEEAFEVAQKIVRQHYQWIVLHDFCTTIAGEQIVEEVLQNGIKCFTHRRLFMPVEFSVAAYRFGHSMIRATYNYNEHFTNATLEQLFEFVRPPLSPVPGNWIIDWKRFFAIDANNSSNLNFARKIDTKVALPLFKLPGEKPMTFLEVLSMRNLLRGVALNLPSGQGVAKRMGVTRLTKDQLLQNVTDVERNLLLSSNEFLIKKTPLWYYILKEAEVLKGGQELGPVGGRLVVEVFVRLLLEDKASILSTPNWKPSLRSRQAGSFTMVDLLNFAGVV